MFLDFLFSSVFPVEQMISFIQEYFVLVLVEQTWPSIIIV